MLVLFDIDGTLLTSEGVGMAAVEGAGRRVFGSSFSVAGVDPGGALDPVLLCETLRRNGLALTHEHLASLRSAYEEELSARLAERNTVRLLAGAGALVERVASSSAMVAGVLTGNFAATGSMKLVAGGLGVEPFEVRVWGDDSPECPIAGRPERGHLGVVALARYAARFGSSIGGERAVVIGDTAHDIACARAVGARSIGVATGRTDAGALRAAGAGLVLEDLSDTGAVMEVIASWSSEQAGMEGVGLEEAER